MSATTRGPMFEYRVQFDVFEGPLDLLLYLIRKEEVSIYEINLTKIATEFIEYIDAMRQMDLVIAGDFLVMASTLMQIKSRELLPVEKRATAEEDEEDETNPKWELIRQLVEYKKFKDAAGKLEDLQHQRENLFPRDPGKIELPTPPQHGAQANVFALVKAVNKVLQRFNEQTETREIFEDQWTVSQKIQYLTQLLRERKTVRFFELFTDATSRSEVVVTFLAVLELIRMDQIVAYQPEMFAEIEIHLIEEERKPTNEGTGTEESPVSSASASPIPPTSEDSSAGTDSAGASSAEASTWN